MAPTRVVLDSDILMQIDALEGCGLGRGLQLLAADAF
jgi:hypothetical protein